MNQFINGIAIASVCSIALLAIPAQAKDSNWYKAEKEKADEQYKVDKKQCDGLTGNDKDVCKTRAKANHEVAEADLKAYEKDTSAAHMKAHQERIDQLHKVDKEKCDAYKGNAKDICVAQADGVKSRREGNLKALEGRLDGDYKVAVEKCENLAGDKRSSCKDEAKRMYKP